MDNFLQIEIGFFNIFTKFPVLWEIGIPRVFSRPGVYLDFMSRNVSIIFSRSEVFLTTDRPLNPKLD